MKNDFEEIVIEWLVVIIISLIILT